MVVGWTDSAYLVVVAAIGASADSVFRYAASAAQLPTPDFPPETHTLAHIAAAVHRETGVIAFRSQAYERVLRDADTENDGAGCG